MSRGGQSISLTRRTHVVRGRSVVAASLRIRVVPEFRAPLPRAADGGEDAAAASRWDAGGVERMRCVFSGDPPRRLRVRRSSPSIPRAALAAGPLSLALRHLD